MTNLKLSKQTEIKYEFIKPNFGDYPERNWLAISKGRIETLNVSDTYGNNGQIISNSDAGDSLELISEKSVKFANDKFNEANEEYINKFKIGDFIYDYDFGNEFDAVQGNCIEGEDFVFYKSTVKGFNFWNGHSWETITVSVEEGEPSHELNEDEELENELNQVIENMVFVKESHGKRQFETDEYIIIESAFADDFEAYEIIEK